MNKVNEKNKMLNKIKNLIDVHGLKNRFLLMIFHQYIECDEY